MGIKGIYSEIGPGDRIAFSKLAVEFFERKGRPLRLAIDVSIWLFQIQAAEGGTNPALRTFYYRILRLIALSIHPLFVFDGPNKPPLKRNKRTLGPGVKTASIPEFLARQLLKYFGLPTHQAPGEAEAECALLQRLDIVDAVLSEDADTLMFGSGLTLRNLSPEGSLKTKTATHISVYDAEKISSGAGLDRHGMILVALMSGGDYIPEGIPGCGPRTACQAARAGFGKQLCELDPNDQPSLTEWKDRLSNEIHTNQSNFFSRKHPTLELPESFPRLDVLRFYTHPCISSERRIDEEVRGKIAWDQKIDIPNLRTFAGDAFEWFNVSGAKKFIRNLAPALLAQELRLRGSGSGLLLDNPNEVAVKEAQFIKSIHLQRKHISTDHTTELRVGFIPLDIVPLNLDAESPDPETSDDILSDKENDPEGEPSSPKKKRAASKFDPTQVEKIWLLETFVKIGVPLKFQDWEESFRNARKYEAMKALTRPKGKSHKGCRKQPEDSAQKGAMDRYTQVTKPSKPGTEASDTKQICEPLRDLGSIARPNDNSKEHRHLPQFKVPDLAPTSTAGQESHPVVDLASSPEKPKKKKAYSRSCSDTFAAVSSQSKDAPVVSQTSAMPKSIGITGTCAAADSELLPKRSSSAQAAKRRSQLHRSQTLSCNMVYTEEGGASGKEESTSTFDEPLGFPQTEAGKDNGRSFRMPESLATCPGTPSHRQKQLIPNVVEINSSPSTPRHQQRAITDWVTPQKLTFRDKSVATETERAIETKSGHLAKAEQQQPEGTSSAVPPRGSHSAATHEEQKRPGKEVIRIRESLDGTWCVQEASLTHNAKATEHLPPGNKRKRNDLRKSRVSVVDLTCV